MARTTAGGVLLGTLGYAWMQSAAMGIAGLTSTIADTLLPAALGRAVDGVLKAPGAGLWGWPAVCAALVGLAALGDVGLELCTGTSAAATTAGLRRELVRHVLSLGPRVGMPAGEVASRVVSSAPDAGIAPSAFVAAGTAVIPPVGALLALFLLDPWLALALLAGLPAVGLLLRGFVRDTSAVVGRYLAVQSAIAARLVEALGGIATIAAAGTAERETDRILADLPDLSRHGHDTWRVQARATRGGALAVPLLQVTVLAVAGLELSRGRLSPGGLLAAGQYAALGAGIGPVIAHLGRLARAHAGARRIAELLRRPAFSYGGAALRPGPGRLEFRAVRAGPVFDGLDLVVPAGATVAVVGRSGSGKSLLALLAGRLADPDGGEVLLDGVPLPELDRAQLRQAFGYAFARPVLFGATICEAIDPDGPGVREAARAARADGFIRRLPHGYETALADAPMSGGELQRIGLARAFARPGRVLVLDDATSSLDTATEAQISRVLADDLGGRTRLIIAHRAGTAARADLVAWLSDGRVRAVAPHAELWRNPDYRAIFQDGTG